VWCRESPQRRGDSIHNQPSQHEQSRQQHSSFVSTASWSSTSIGFVRLALTSTAQRAFEFQFEIFLLADVKALHEQEESKSPSAKSVESSVSSLHIVEEVKLNRDARVANQQPIDEVSVCSSIEDDKASLQSEILKLCDEIEDANGTKRVEDSSVDLTYRDEATFRSIMAKV
jgi:hypothetical protein